MMLQLIDKKIKIYFYLISFLLFSSIYNFKLIIYFKEIFKITYIETQSNNIQIMEVNNLIDKSIFYIDKKIIKKAFLENPIIKSFEVKKIYPNKLKINLVKSKPVAKIITNNDGIYFGDNGKIFNSNETFESIPKIIGEINLNFIKEIINIINNSSFDIFDIKIIKIHTSSRFDLIFKNNKIIKFPLNINEEIMINAFGFYKNKDIKKNVIDLRLKNKIIISNE
tara:strand:- start:635 stop:1306 length:672 start_codon:yes stop_codon:yes gene_type:complete